MSKRVLLILNPISGKKIGKRYLADVLERFCRADYIPTVFVTTGRGHAQELARTHGGAVDLVVCLGGDGTFNEMISGLLDGGHTTPVGYLPCGSTNDFASGIGLKKTIKAATDAILAGEGRRYDVGVFGDRYFTYVASFGIFTRTSYATPQNVKNALGHLAYLLEGVKELSNIRPWHVKFEVDGEVVEGDYIFGAVSNATSVGGVLTLDRQAVDMNDGKLELLLVKMPRNPVELSACIRALAEQQYDTDVITFMSGSAFQVTADSEMEWTLDGEHAQGAASLCIRAQQDAFLLVH